ncbi:MAG: hypothetical protein JWO06_2201, partial [Bacteroidota bacterium]|nr:hypothetical protein [Bacteroidota bacterium]
GVKQLTLNDSYIRSMKWMLGLLFCCSALSLFSQSDTVVIKITVTDSYTKKPMAGVSIIDQKSSITFATDAKGYVQDNIHKGDILFLFYPGYKTMQFTVADSALKQQYTLHFQMEPLSTGLNQGVTIRGAKSLPKIEEERRKLGQTPKELQRPEINPFTSPISALYEILSARAKEREKLKKQIVEDDRRKIFKELLDYYNENHLIDLPKDHYEDFINYCNLPLDFLKYNTDYEITKTVVTLFGKYSRVSGLVK